jgi:hypothetical protein
MLERFFKVRTSFKRRIAEDPDLLVHEIRVAQAAVTIEID